MRSYKLVNLNVIKDGDFLKLKLKKDFALAELIPLSALFTLMLFSLTFPLGFLVFEDKSKEIALNLYFVIFMCILFTQFLATILLARRKNFYDYKGFISTLIFALLFTAPTIFVSPSFKSDTFGTADFKTLTPIFMISVISFFYLTRFFVKSRAIYIKFIDIMSIGFVIFFLVANLIENKYFVFNILLFSLPFFAYQIFKLRKKSFLYFGFFILVTFYLEDKGFLNTTLLFTVLSIIFLFSIMVGILFIGTKKEVVKDRFKNSYRELGTFFKYFSKGTIEKNNSKNLVKSLTALSAYFLPLILLGILVAMYSHNSVLWKSTYNLGYQSLKASFDVLKATGKTEDYFTGLGSVYSRTSLTYAGSLLITLGFVGTGAFAFISGYFKLVTFKNLKASLEKGENIAENLLLSFLVTSILIFGFLNQINIFHLILLWFSFIGISLMGDKNIEFSDFTKTKIKYLDFLAEKKLNYLFLLLLIVIEMLILYLYIDYQLS